MHLAALLKKIHESPKMERFNDPSIRTLAICMGLTVAFLELTVISIFFRWSILTITGFAVVSLLGTLTAIYCMYAQRQIAKERRELAYGQASTAWNTAADTAPLHDQENDRREKE